MKNGESEVDGNYPILFGNSLIAHFSLLKSRVLVVNYEGRHVVNGFN